MNVGLYMYVYMYVCYICTDMYILSYNGDGPSDGATHGVMSVPKMLLP